MTKDLPGLEELPYRPRCRRRRRTGAGWWRSTRTWSSCGGRTCPRRSASPSRRRACGRSSTRRCLPGSGGTPSWASPGHKQGWLNWCVCPASLRSHTQVMFSLCLCGYRSTWMLLRFLDTTHVGFNQDTKNEPCCPGKRLLGCHAYIYQEQNKFWVDEWTPVLLMMTLKSVT